MKVTKPKEPYRALEGEDHILRHAANYQSPRNHPGFYMLQKESRSHVGEKQNYYRDPPMYGHLANVLHAFRYRLNLVRLSASILKSKVRTIL